MRKIIIILCLFCPNLLYAGISFYPSTFFPVNYINGNYFGYTNNVNFKTGVYVVNLKISNTLVSGSVVKKSVDVLTNIVGKSIGPEQAFLSTCTYNPELNLTGFGSVIGKPVLSCLSSNTKPSTKIDYMYLNNGGYLNDNIKTYVRLTYIDPQLGPLELNVDLTKY